MIRQVMFWRQNSRGNIRVLLTFRCLDGIYSMQVNNFPMSGNEKEYYLRMTDPANAVLSLMDYQNILADLRSEKVEFEEISQKSTG